MALLMHITDEIVEKVESSVGMGHGAWDMVDPREIINASVEAVLELEETIPPPTREEYLDAFRKEVDDKFKQRIEGHDLYDETDFKSLTQGWAIANGMSLTEAYEFASFVRYKTDMA